MDKRLLNQLIHESLTNNSLDDKKVTAIADSLNRKLLKQYIDGLKKWLKKNSVMIESATDVDTQMQEEYKKLFAGKQVTFIKRPELLVGLRIVDNDIIYEMNLQDTLHDIQQYLTQ